MTGAVRLQVTWGAASDSGDVTYRAGFSTSLLAKAPELTAYDGPGTHSIRAGSQQLWYATERYRDDAGNISNVTVGPFYAANGQ